MENQLSIVDTEQEINLATNKEDMMSLFVKSIFSIVPFGSPIGEAITAVIPHQKLERVVDFVQVLNYKIKNAERKIEEQELKTEEFTDLLEDALGQASRALSKERLEYIATLLANSLTVEELKHIETKKLLAILNEVNDTEIIWLQYYALYDGEKNKFYDEHEKILEIFPTNLPSSPKEYDKQSIQRSYKHNLIRLGLLKEKFKQAKKGEFPEIDYNTGKPKVSHYETSSLGNALLRIIQLKPSDEDAYQDDY